MKNIKRGITLLLCIVMVLSLLPASITNVFAAGDTIYVLAGGDFQEGNSDGTTLHVNSSENVRNILTQIYDAGYTHMDGMLFVGDYDGTDHNNADKVANGINSLMSTVQERYSNINDANSILVQGNHDNMDSRIDATGGYEMDGYAVYVLNEDDYVNGGGSDADIKKLAENMEQWLNERLLEGYDAPIFITAHVPLHYSPRTNAQGDGKYAKYLVDVLNEAGEEGLNIIFLHGHDHAYGCDNYLGGEAIYRAKGDSLLVAPLGGGTPVETTLNFTYMNAGYTGYYNESGYDINNRDDSKLTMTVFAITDNKVTVERYSADGKYNLSSAGRDGSYGNYSASGLGLPYNTAVYGSPQTIKLNTNDVTEDAGTIGSWVEYVANPPADDVTPSGAGWVEVIAPTINTLEEDVEISGNEWTTLREPTAAVPGKTTYRYELATSITARESYVIVGNNHDVALTNNGNNNTMGATSVDIENNIIYSDTQLTEWTFSSATSGTIKHKDANRYLRYSGNNFGLGTSSSTLRITNNGSNFRIYSSNYSFYYSGSAWTRVRNTGYVRLYKQIDPEVTEETPAENGLYAYLKGELRYTITDGMDAATALQMVKDGIDVQYATAADYSDEQTYPDNGDGLTWTLDPSYDPNVSGDYAVTIAYNGTTIGVAEVIVPPKADVPGTYYQIAGELSYEATAGMTSDEALALVMAGIDGYKYDAMSMPGADVTGEKVDDSALTWEWVDTYDPNVPGDYAVKISCNGKELGIAEVIVPTTKTYYAAEGKALCAVEMNASAEEAMAYVKQSVDIYTATDANGANKTLVSDDQATWTWVDPFDGANIGPYTVEITKDGVSLGTVEVKVNVKYQSGIADGWTYVGDTESSGGTTTHTYILDTDGIEYGEEHKYIIVDDNEKIVLNANSSSNGTAHSITITGNTATLNTRDYEYHMIQKTYNRTRYELITKGDSKYLYQESNGVRYGTRDSVKFQINHKGNGLYEIHDIDGTNWYIIYNNGWTVTESTSARVRLYKYEKSETVGAIPGGPQYVKLEGSTLYAVSTGTSRGGALNAVKAGLTAYISDNANGTDATVLNDSELTYTWKNTYNGNVTGSYYVEVSYKDEVLGTVEVVVEPGVVNNYPEYPKEGAVKVNKTATGLDFQASGVAQVEVSASGVPSKKGADVIVMLDTSSSMESWCICGTQNCNQSGTSHQRRSAVLEESLKNLIAAFQQNGADGLPLDIRVAVADFNGFNGYGGTTGTPYDRDRNDTMTDDVQYSANGNQGTIYTSDSDDLDYTAFMNAQDLPETFDLNYASGTNYDYAFDAIYQMGASVKAHNETVGEERDLYVLFMSDGAAMQWNYYHSQGASSLWNEWLTGQRKDSNGNVTLTYQNLEQVESNLLSGGKVNTTANSYYFNLQDTNGDKILNEHRMANAVKGDPNTRYEVIRKTTEGIDDIQNGSNTNLYTVPGLGATVFSIAFDPHADNNVTAASMEQSIATLASEQVGTTRFYYRVTTAAELSDAFTAIGSEVAYAANNARFVDQMGSSFNLQMGNLSYLPTGENNTNNKVTIVPYIEILTYDIWTREDFKRGDITEDQIGVRKGTSALQELVAFSRDGSKAYSNLIDVDGDGVMGVYDIKKNADGTYSFKLDEADDTTAGDNIMDANKVIWARTFYYNANNQPVALPGVAIPTGINSDGTTKKTTTNVLPAETFYWKLGTVQTTELAMRYFVYLEGSLEGMKPGGSYATNEFAVLYYDNYLGNPCYKDTVSPQLGWQEANVSYAFYLVNTDGEIITNQATGETGTFANKVAVTNPVVYDTILLNNQEELRVLEVAAIGDDVLPRYYTLYDEAAIYEVHPNSNSTGYWDIVKGDGLRASTYITNHTIGSGYSNALHEDNTAYDYTHTVVWFAVVWSIEAHPDAVVVDYGLPVEIDVLSNDMFGSAGKINSVSSTIPWLTDANGELVLDKHGKQQVYIGHDATVRDGFKSSITTQFGTATVDTSANKIIYELSVDQGMKMNSIDQFAYAVQYTGSKNAGYYYDAVTVIPATTIYYEESFVQFAGSNTNWSNAGSAMTDVKQDEDRPGSYSLSDANNIYGYDSMNKGMSQFSLGTAKKVHVDAGSYATATFSFIGTGFDVISMTSSDTGVIAVQVKNAEGAVVEAKVVNTYYGAIYNETTGEWELTGAAADVPNEIWQVPVLKVDDLAYGAYSVTITATYAKVFDKTSSSLTDDEGNPVPDGYWLYLDAIRIYDPAGTEYGTDDSADGITGNLIHSEIQNAYAVDGEAWPVYYELRNMLLTDNSFDNAAEAVGGMDANRPGVVFIDGMKEVGDDKIDEYASYGPNNEVYLLPGQRVAFLLDESVNIDKVHLGMRSADGKLVKYTITNIAAADIANTSVFAGDYYNIRNGEVDTTTDMYYDLTTWKGDIIVVSNTGNRYGAEGVLALTNIKITHEAEPVAVKSHFRMTNNLAKLTLMSLASSEPEQNTIGNTNVPEVDETPEVEPTKPVEPNETPEVEQTKPVKPNETPEVETSKPQVSDKTPESGTSKPQTSDKTQESENDKPVELDKAPDTEDNALTDDAVEEQTEVMPEDMPMVGVGGMTEDVEEQLGFWARLWNAIKNVFERFLNWLGL